MKAAEAKRVRWTVKEYFRLDQAGVLNVRRVELINGEIIEVPAQATPHRTAITKISRLLVKAFGPSEWVVIQGTLILSRYDAPDPDFHVFAAPEGTPDQKLPPPLFVIEVSDSTYRKDSGPKLRTYARAGIADYWIVNLNEERVEIYRQPENATGKRSGWGYTSIAYHTRRQEVRPLNRPQLTFAVDAMLP